MNCEKYSEKISLYIDEELEENDRAMFEEHITNCYSCQEEVQILQEITNDIKDLGQIELPESFHQSLMERLQIASEASQDKVIQLPINKRKWFTNFRIAGAVAAVFIFSVILIKPLKINSPKDSMMQMADMEESQEIEDNIVGSRMMLEPPEDIVEGSPVDLSGDSSVQPASEHKAGSIQDLPEAKPANIPVESYSAEESTGALGDEPAIASAMLNPEDTLPVETCTVMTEKPKEDKDYIIDTAKKIGIKPIITETTGTAELQNQIITIEMIINIEQGNELDDKMRGLDKSYDGSFYDSEEGSPETFKLIIFLTEYHNPSNQ